MDVYNFSKGVYLIGDPAYFFHDKGHDEWLRFLEVNNFVDEDGEGRLLSTNDKVVVFSTNHGDGLYLDDLNNEYTVDSGLIGIIPFRENSDIPHGMNKIEFDKDFECYKNGFILHFGDITIDTDKNPRNFEHEFEEFGFDSYDNEGELFDEY
jgi:hypothetical protein